MTADQIARALGAACRSGRWWSCRCPAHDDRSPSLSLRDGDRGLIVRCWAGCNRCDVLAKLQRLGLASDDRRAADATDERPDDRRDRARRIELARRIWTAARDVRGTPVERYLAGRGITMPLPSSLRWAARCRHPSGVLLPAMLARIDNIDGELIGIHRTFLRPDGNSRAGIEPVKAMLGRTASGAVRLAPAAEALLIGEGLETCLAAMLATAQPGWAALSTSGMTALMLPPVVRTVIILADHDRSGAGERAARAAGQRWLAEGRQVRIAKAPEPGTDMADVLAGRAHARIAAVRDVAA